MHTCVPRPCLRNDPSPTTHLHQEGVDAPPEEERLGGALEEAEEVALSELDPDLAGDADLSFATMFARCIL